VVGCICQKFTAKPVGERILKIGYHFVKVRGKSRMTPVSGHGVPVVFIFATFCKLTRILCAKLQYFEPHIVSKMKNEFFSKQSVYRYLPNPV